MVAGQVSERSGSGGRNCPGELRSPHIFLSILIKCLNEQDHLASCITSVIAAANAESIPSFEIILADSISTDRSVAIARSFPVRVVQLAHASDRSCGSAAQIAYQVARGDYLLLIDGDMELQPGFLSAALRVVEREPDVAAVGGRLIETSTAIEFKERQRREPPPGEREVITGCALYRASAIVQLGSFMNRNLHAFEEGELGARLRARGWRLRSLDVGCVVHHGNPEPARILMRANWRNGRYSAYGELLRASWRLPWRKRIPRACFIPLAVIAWWVVLLGLIAAVSLGSAAARIAMPAFALALPLIIWSRKPDLRRCLYTLGDWHLAAAGIVAGLFSSAFPPGMPVAYKTLQDEPFEQETGVAAQ
ncbi:MAG: glycosyltransferase [Acetobacteraceae bacterium]|nr:glycosyltransferase [Acetobacteraceae bacterium]